jgi:mandelate racemase
MTICPSAGTLAVSCQPWPSCGWQAEAASLPVSSHLFFEASAHTLAVTPTADWLEYLDLAGPVLADPCNPVNGYVTAVGPGLGINWNEAAIVEFAA